MLVGITPGHQQMVNALKEAQSQLLSGASPDIASKSAKNTASFSGAMRNNLVRMLDYFRINELLGIASCKSLFGQDAHLVHCTSVLRYPVFFRGANYTGQPLVLHTPPLKQQLLKYFAAEARVLPNAVFVPLGAKVADVLEFLVERGDIDRTQVLDGLQHPSGANAERVAYLLGRKSAGALSSKTSASSIDAARDRLSTKVAKLLLKVQPV